MKTRIRIIFLLILASIVGLLVIQGFWIAKFYQINRQQVSKEIKLSLENSVKVEMSLRYALRAKEFLPDIDTESMIIVGDTTNNVKMDSIVKLMRARKQLNPTDVSISITSIGDSIPVLDSIPEKIEFRLRELVGTLMSNRPNDLQQVDLKLVDSLLKTEFKQRGIDVEYNLEVYDRLKDTIESELLNFPSIGNTSGRSGVFLLHEVPATIMGDKEIRLTTINSVGQVFNSPIVKGSLLATLILLILIVSSYFYMLKTIFDQKKLSTIKNDFINNMTHELKTPIATVSAIVESMQNFGVLDDKVKTHKYLGVSQKELGRLSGLVEKVLNMAREEREPLKMSPEELNVREICDNIINSESIKQAEKDVSFDVKIEEEAEKVMADRFHMVNVMQNLIENSIKYSEDPVIIRIACERRKDFIKISVSDNGIGIPKKHQGKVFDQFYRVPTGDVHNVKGFGLGLHYVRNIVEKHGGKISLNSEPGNGSTFTINLPV
jgi:two-component system phosphate regulon sensor histidine kinase PhoR